MSVIEPDLRRGRAIRSRPTRPSHATFSLVNARAVFPDRVQPTDIVVRDGIIHRIGVMSAAAARRVDCAGDFLLPGLMEIHTDNLERHIEPRPGTFRRADRAVLSHDAELASSGITTAFEAITLGAETGGGARDEAYLEAISSLGQAQSQDLLRVEHHLHLRCELGSPRLGEYLRRAMERRAPRVMSLMEHVPGQGQWQSVDRFREHYARRYGLTPAAIDELIVRRKQDQAKFSAGNRQLVTQLARQHECILASHDDAVAADVECARQSGCRISEFPTTLEAALAARNLRMYVIAGAPNLVRGGSHSGNVAAEELAGAGVIDILSSDYCPDSLLDGVFALARVASIPLHIAAAAATSTPAHVLNLQDRGAIAEGLRADLIRVRETSSGPVVVAAWCAGRQVA